MKLYLSIFLLLFACQLFSQHKIEGVIVNQKNESIDYASVWLLNPIDSSVVITTHSDEKGRFFFENISQTYFLLKVRSFAYEAATIPVHLTELYTRLDKIVLLEESTNLDEVVIKEKINPLVNKSDTIDIKASSFKVNKDANAEELVSKMPGITQQNGKLQAHGEDIKQVLVDGKPFMGEDPNAALKNVPAEMVDRIQIFDRRSEQAQFTGFDDGNNNKTLNITTKLEYRNGVFGRAHIAAGSSNRWKNSESINFFKPKQKISLLLNQNNINEINFSQEDLLGVFSAAGSFGGRGGSGGPGGRPGGSRGGPGGRGNYGSDNPAGNFLVDQKNGLNTVHSFGANYTAQFKKLDLVGSYFLNQTSNKTNSNLTRDYFSSDYGLPNYAENSDAKSSNFNNRINLRMDLKLDSANTLLIIPRFSFQSNKTDGLLHGSYTELGTLQSQTNNNSNSKGNAWSGGINFYYRHAFHKRGRSFSVTFSPSQNQSSSSSNLNAVDSFYQIPPVENLVSQEGTGSKAAKTLGSSILFTEPIKKYSQLVATLQFNNSISAVDKFTYNHILATTVLDSSLSNDFENKYQTVGFGLNYRYNRNKLNFSFANLLQSASLKTDQFFPQLTPINKSYFNYLPNLSAQYKLKPNVSIRLNYRASNSPPSAEQLQELVINNNSLQLSMGNSDLDQEFFQNASLRLSSNSLKNQSSFFFVISATDVVNYISTNSIIPTQDILINNNLIVRAGSQLSQYINTNAHNRNLRSFVNYSIPISKIKTNASLYSGATILASPYAINSEEKITNSISWNNGISLSSNISPKLDFNLGYYFNLTNTKSDNENLTDNNVLTHNINFRWVYQFWKGLNIRTDYSFNYNPNINSSIATKSYNIWNAAIGYKFTKHELAEIRLSVFDILKQNNAIYQSSNELYIESSQNNNITQHVLLNFIYQLKKFKSPSNNK